MTPSRYRYFAIFAGMRTGSNLLERLLGQLSGVTIHGELFNPTFIGKPGQEQLFGITRMTREARPLMLVEQVVAESRGSLPGFRLFSDHDQRVLRRALTDPDCGKIILTRDTAESYVSLKIARETDQWMLSNVKKRRDAQVRFDAGEFAQYECDTAEYYGMVRRILQEHGQSAFQIDYSEIKELPVLNGLAAYLGLESRFDTVSEPIVRQNPGPLTDKVLNPQEMQAALAQRGEDWMGPRSAKPREPKGGLRRLHGALKVPVIYAQIPGGPEELLLRWMHGADGGIPTRPDFETARGQGLIDQSFSNRKALRDWLSDHPNRLVFTVLRHPLERAYRVFEQRILRGGDDGFPMIREQLRQNYRMRVPDEDLVRGLERTGLERLGHDTSQHRAAFHIFLEFVKANLAGQTSLRTDPRWAPQRDYLDGFQALVPLGLVAREDQLIKAAAYMRNALNLGAVKNGILKSAQPDFLFPLSEIATQETNDLARAAWPGDFDAFGFEDWGQAAG